MSGNILFWKTGWEKYSIHWKGIRYDEIKEIWPEHGRREYECWVCKKWRHGNSFLFIFAVSA